MKKIISVFLAVIMIMSSFMFSASALTKDESEKAVDLAYSAMYEGVKGDVNNDNKFNAADARSALLYSAGLVEGNFDALKADTDCDGKITAVDARTLLRVSASLEPVSVLETAVQLNMVNALLNSVKAYALAYKKNSATTNIDITYDHKSDVDNFTKQLKKFAEDGEDMDFGAMLTEGKGEVKYDNLSIKRAATDANFPIKGEDFSSLLTTDNIDRIEYKANQKFSYQQMSPRNIPIYAPIERENVDALTVYFKTETLTVIPDDSMVTNHGKCFDVLTKKTLNDGYGSINDMMGGDDMKALVASMPGASFDMRVDHNYLTYRDSYVTVYFDSNTKELCGVDYNMTYDFSIALYMNIYLIALIVNIDFRNKTINVVNTDNISESYCFID